jgi:hypothetical protein
MGSDSGWYHHPTLTAEEIPEIQSLHVHQIMIDHGKIPHCNDERDDHCDDRIIQRAHALFSSSSFFLLAYISTRRLTAHPYRHQQSAGALNSGKPIEKPNPNCTSDVENHLADFDF